LNKQLTKVYMSVSKDQSIAQKQIEEANPQSQYELMERLDEKQIVAEAAGEMSESWVYSFPQDGKMIMGLSYVGVKEAVRQLNAKGLTSIKISEQAPPVTQRVSEGHDLYVEEAGDGYFVQAYGKDEKHNGGLWGAKFEPIYKQRSSKKGGGKYCNIFALEHALSKAQRNAMRGLIPENLFVKILKEFIEKGKVQKLTPKEVKDLIGAFSKQAEKLIVQIESAKTEEELQKIGQKIANLTRENELSVKEHKALQDTYSYQLKKFKNVSNGTKQDTPAKGNAKSTQLHKDGKGKDSGSSDSGK
jgi:hypothetical protein